MALVHVRTAQPSRPMLAALCAIAFVFGTISVATLSSQLRVNLRDLHQASRIFDRREAAPGYAAALKLVVNGGSWDYPDRVKKLWGDLNVSAFIALQSKANLIIEVSGAKLVASYQEQDLARGRSYCESVEPWPASRSVVVLDTLAVVCLTPLKT